MKQVFLPDIRELAIVRRDLRQDSLGRCIPMSIIALLPTKQLQLTLREIALSGQMLRKNY